MPDDLRSTRAMLLAAAGALTGLGIAGYGLFTAAGTTTHAVPPEDVALVNQRPILRSDFINQLQAETGLKFSESTEADRLKVLDEMVREELLVQRGLELDFAETDQSTRNALVSTVTQQVTVSITTDQPSEDQLRDFYESHKAQYATDGTMLVRNFIVSGRSAGQQDRLDVARRAAQALRTGQPLERVVAQYGLTEAKRNDEDYYFAAKYRLGDALFAAVRDLGDGEVSAPVTLPDGVHIVLMVRNAKPVPQGYAASRTQVFSDYRSFAQQRVLDETMAFLRHRSSILIAADYAGRYRP
jgi:parvulin-like peptidyl-prolyl isomerase